MFGSLRGVPVSVEPIWLESKLPGAVSLYRVPIDPADAALAAQLLVAAAPSGDGELAVSGVSIGSGAGRSAVGDALPRATTFGALVRFTLSAGQPARAYTLVLTAVRSDGLLSTRTMRVKVDSVLVTDQPQAAPSAGFGTPAVWPL
jgi:hypothetical protein